MIGLMIFVVWMVFRIIYIFIVIIIYLMVFFCYGSEFDNDICFFFKVIKFNFIVDFIVVLIVIIFW